MRSWRVRLALTCAALTAVALGAATLHARARAAGGSAASLAAVLPAGAPVSLPAAAQQELRGGFRLTHTFPADGLDVVGGAGGRLKGDRHLAYASRTVPTGNLLLSILDVFDVKAGHFGDRTGRLANI